MGMERPIQPPHREYGPDPDAEDRAHDDYVQRWIDKGESMSCTILKVQQKSATPLTVYKYVKIRFRVPGDIRTMFFGPEYSPENRGPVEGWHDPKTIESMKIYKFVSSGLGQDLEYHYGRVTRSPDGPGIMVFVDPPTFVPFETPSFSEKIWIMGRIPALTAYRVGFHDDARILCADAFEPICRLLK